MDFHVSCQCGESLRVSEGAAGARLNCSCGRVVVVPSLSELREQAGLAANQPSAKLVIESMLAGGELPTATTCAHCDRDANETVYLTAECEKAFGSEPDRTAAILAILIFGLWGWLVYLFRTREATEFGDNVILHLPVRLCPDCRRSLLGGSNTGGFGLIAALLGACGVVTMIVWSKWGGLFLVGSFFALVTKFIARMRQDRQYKWLLGHESIYGRLLDDFPQAILLLSDDQHCAAPPPTTAITRRLS